MRLSHQIGISILGGLALAQACATPQPAPPPQQAQLARAVSAPDGSGPPKPLSATAREILKRRMVSHAKDMGDLVAAIMAVDYPNIVQRAEAIAGDVNLSRPITRDATELNASLPEEFFARQDDLRGRARALAEAARALDSARVAREYGQLAEGCVRCHADFRPRR